MSFVLSDIFQDQVKDDTLILSLFLFRFKTMRSRLYSSSIMRKGTYLLLVLQSSFTGVRCISVEKYKFPVHQIIANRGRALSQQQSGWVLKALMLYVSSFKVSIWPQRPL